MNTCPACSKSIKPDAKFCKHCHTSFEEDLGLPILDQIVWCIFFGWGIFAVAYYFNRGKRISGKQALRSVLIGFGISLAIGLLADFTGTI